MSLLLDALKKNAASNPIDEPSRAMNDTLDASEHAPAKPAAREVRAATELPSAAVGRRARAAAAPAHEANTGGARSGATASSHAMAQRALRESQKRARSVFTKQTELPPLKPRKASRILLGLLLLVGFCGSLAYLSISSENDQLNSDLASLTDRINHTLVLASEVDMPSPLVQTQAQAPVEPTAAEADSASQPSPVAEADATAEQPALAVAPAAEAPGASAAEPRDITLADLGIDWASEELPQSSLAVDIDAFLNQASLHEEAAPVVTAVSDSAPVLEVPASLRVDEDLEPAREPETAVVEQRPSLRETREEAAGEWVIARQSDTSALSLAQSAYQAYLAGRLDESHSRYQQLLQQDPRNRDALLGLAALALRTQQNAAAVRYYQQVLQEHPRDEAAIAGLAAVRANASNGRAETELRMRLRETPDSAPLNFSLGSLLSREQRWSEAQAAFFRAFAANAQNPDYAYNLAVSLDQLGQRAAARQYYQQALALSERYPAGFDRSVVRQRIEALAL